MPRLFIANFDFEHRLACGQGTLPKVIARINSELAPVWAAIADDGDAVWTPTPIDPGIFQRIVSAGLPRLSAVIDPQAVPGWYDLVFWGENEWAARAADRWKLRWDGCDAAIVRRVNSRRFAFAVEQRLGLALPGSAIVENPRQLATAIACLTDPSGWVLKGEFGNAGREVRFGSGSLSETDAAWAGNRFRRKLALLVEPRLTPVDEVGLQFQIDRAGFTNFVGLSPLLTRPNGGYLGSRFDDDSALNMVWQEAIDVAYQVAEAVAATGYFGQLGIDAMRHRTADGAVQLRPVQDINARFTMGRLALGLRRFPPYAVTHNGVFNPGEFRAAPSEQARPALAAG